MPEEMPTPKKSLKELESEKKQLENLETKKIQFVCGKSGAKPYLVLIEAVKGGKPATELLPSLVNEK